MTIFTVQFDYKGERMYDRLMKVFKASVLRVMPDVHFEERNLSCPGTKIKKFHSLLSNTLKLREWVAWMDKTNDNTVFMDCDMLLLQSIECAFEEDFDVAYTVRTSAQMPMNGGVVFAKPTPKARQFFRAWLDVNERMFTNRVFHEPYRRKYAGMNQAAFGYLLENPVAGVNLIKLPCAIWNSCSEDWRFVDGFTKVVHVKSVLRKVVTNPTHNGYPVLARIWREFEAGSDPSDLINSLSKKDVQLYQQHCREDGVIVHTGTQNTDEFIKRLRSYRKLPDRKEVKEARVGASRTYNRVRKRQQQKTVRKDK